MIYVNLILSAVLLLCALALVTSQHKTRNLIVTIDNEQVQQRVLEDEYNKLRMEIATFTKESHVERVAKSKLGMHLNSQKSPDFIQLVPPLPRHQADEKKD